MKQALVILAVVASLSSIGLYCVDPQPSKSPDDPMKRRCLEINPPIALFDVYEDTDRLHAKFELKNVSGRAIQIREVKTSCSCTAANLERQVIGPEETLTFHAHYNVRGSIGELARRQIIVVTDETLCCEIVAEIGGTRRRRFEVEPGVIRFDDVAFGTSPTRELTILSRGRKGLRPTQASNASSKIKLRFLRQEEIGADVAYHFEAILLPDAPIGILNENLLFGFFADHEREPFMASISVCGSVVGPISFEPPTAFLGFVDAANHGEQWIRIVPLKASETFPEMISVSAVPAFIRIDTSHERPGQLRVTTDGQNLPQGSFNNEVVVAIRYQDQTYQIPLKIIAQNTGTARPLAVPLKTLGQ